MNDDRNAYTGALFATAEDGVLTGPFTLPSGDKARVRCELGAGENGQHLIHVFGITKTGKLTAKPVAIGHFGRTRDFDLDNPPNSPVGKGRLTGKSKVLQIVVFANRHELTGESYYRIQPDRPAADVKPLPKI